MLPTAAFEANGDEQGKLEANAKQLEKQIDLQKQKMNLLEDAVQKAAEKYGENSIEATRLRGAMYDAQAGVAELEAELRDTNSRLDNGEEAMDDFGEATDDASDKAIDFGDVLMANVISDAIMDGLREMADCIKEFATGSIEAAAEMNAVDAQVEQTFGTMEKLASDALESISNDTNIATTRMQGSFTGIYAFAKTTGASAENALTISSRAMVVAADNAAYYDKSIEEATETLQAFLKGNYANDAALGIACTETTRNTKANELYAKSFSELSESQKVDVLLAMVEAGNEASGAIGQAARESDSWENVTGELAEVMRQLQVEAGKPALQKLIPIIKKITSAGYDLIEDIDWDDFADKVENLVDGVIEYGPGVVKAIAAVAAAIVAMKAVKKAEEIAGIVTSFVSIGTAATTTAETMVTTGAIASATPWGAVAAVVGAAAALITAYSLQADTDAQKLSKAMESLQDKMADIDADYNDEKTEIEGAAGAAAYYVDRLQELETAGLTTAAAHKEYEMVVEQLNELIPDLNLTINEQTGLIDQNLESVKESADAWKESALQAAMQERVTDILKAQAKAEAAVIEAEAKLNILRDKGEDLMQAQEDAYEDVEDASEAVRKATENLTKATLEGGEAEAEANLALIEANRTLEEKQKIYLDAEEAVTSNREAQKELSDEITESKEIVASYADEMELAEEMSRIYEDTTDDVTADQAALNQAIEDTQNALDALESAYDEAYAEAYESISGQLKLFDDLGDEADYSADKVIESWKKQRKALLEYSDNLQKAADMGLSKALIEQLSDGSEQSMMILAEWVKGTEQDIADINAAYDGLIDGQEVAAKTVTELVNGFDGQMDELYAQAEKMGLKIVDGIVVGTSEAWDKAVADIESRSENLGLMVADGIVVGVTKGMPDVSKIMADLADVTINGYATAMDSHSPARKMIPGGKNAVGGVVVGIEDNTAELEAAMDRLAMAGVAAFDQARLDQMAEYPTMVTAGTAANQQTSVSNNYGGVSIQIYPREGQSAEEIADAVMDKLQTEIIQKEAAW